VATLSLQVTGAKPLQGQVLAALYASEASFMSEPLAQLRAPVAADGTVALDFGELQPGEYAISVVHDQNGNGELDTGWFGIPREPFGFSTGARARFGPPAWRDARFSLVGERAHRLQIELARALGEP